MVLKQLKTWYIHYWLCRKSKLISCPPYIRYIFDTETCCLPHLISDTNHVYIKKKNYQELTHVFDIFPLPHPYGHYYDSPLNYFDITVSHLFFKLLKTLPKPKKKKAS